MGNKGKGKWVARLLGCWILLFSGFAFGQETTPTTKSVPAIQDSIDSIVKRTTERGMGFLAETFLIMDSISTLTLKTKNITLTHKARSESKTRMAVWFTIAHGDVKMVYNKCKPLDRYFMRQAARSLRQRAISIVRQKAQTQVAAITSATLGLNTNED